MIRLPEISLFFGIRITINYNYHVPPHFHAEYNGEKALVDIINDRIGNGSYQRKHLFKRRPGKGRRSPVSLKQRWSDQIHPSVRALGGKDDAYKQLERI